VAVAADEYAAVAVSDAAAAFEPVAVSLPPLAAGAVAQTGFFVVVLPADGVVALIAPGEFYRLLVGAVLPVGAVVAFEPVAVSISPAADAVLQTGAGSPPELAF